MLHAVARHGTQEWRGRVAGSGAALVSEAARPSRLDRLTLVVEHDRKPEDLVDPHTIGGKGRDTGFVHHLLVDTLPQRRTIPPCTSPHLDAQNYHPPPNLHRDHTP